MDPPGSNAEHAEVIQAAIASSKVKSGDVVVEIEETIEITEEEAPTTTSGGGGGDEKMTATTAMGFLSRNIFWQPRTGYRLAQALLIFREPLVFKLWLAPLLNAREKERNGS